MAWAERIRTEWARRAPETRRASSWPLSLELIEPAQGGDDPLPGATVFPAVLDDLEVGAGPGRLGAEEHGDLPVGRVTIIMGRFPPISRGKLLKTWHHV